MGLKLKSREGAKSEPPEHHRTVVTDSRGEIYRTSFSHSVPTQTEDFTGEDPMILLYGIGRIDHLSLAESQRLLWSCTVLSHIFVVW